MHSHYTSQKYKHRNSQAHQSKTKSTMKLSLFATAAAVVNAATAEVAHEKT
jgi:hypothetical protein